MFLLVTMTVLLFAGTGQGFPPSRDIEPLDDGLSLEGFDLGVDPELDSNILDDPFAGGSLYAPEDNEDEDDPTELVKLIRTKRGGEPSIDTFTKVRDALDIAARAEKLSTKNEHKIGQLGKAVGLTALSLTKEVFSHAQQRHLMEMIKKEAHKWGGAQPDGKPTAIFKQQVKNRNMEGAGGDGAGGANKMAVLEFGDEEDQQLVVEH